MYKGPLFYYLQTSAHSTIKAIGYQYPIYYANGDLFTREVYRLASIKPEVLRKQIRRASQLSRTNSLASCATVNETNSSKNLVGHFKVNKVNCTYLDIVFDADVSESVCRV